MSWKPSARAVARKRVEDAAAAQAREFGSDAPAPARRRPHAARGAPRAVVLLFLLFFAEIVFGMIGATDDFTPADGVLSACALVALVHAGAMSWCFEVARKRGGGSIGGPRGVSSPGAVLFLGFLLFLGIWLVDGLMVCGHLNRLVGIRSVETTTVEARYRRKDNGCQFHVSVFGPTVASGTSLCLDVADWRRIAVGDHLPLAVVNGRLGQSVSLIRDGSKGAR